MARPGIDLTETCHACEYEMRQPGSLFCKWCTEAGFPPRTRLCYEKLTVNGVDGCTLPACHSGEHINNTEEEFP